MTAKGGFGLIAPEINGPLERDFVEVLLHRRNCSV